MSVFYSRFFLRLYSIIGYYRILSIISHVLCCANFLQSCSTLWEAMDCSPPGSSVHGIFQARILEWASDSYSRGSSRPGDPTCISVSPALADGFFTTSATWEALVSVCLKSKRSSEVWNYFSFEAGTYGFASAVAKCLQPPLTSEILDLKRIADPP